MKTFRMILESAAVVGALALVGCSSTSSDTGDSGTNAGCPAQSDAGCPAKADAGCPAKDGGCPASEAGCPAGCPAATPGDSDTPPTGKDEDISAWLAKGDYKKGNWKCEADAHASRSPSPHAQNRICSNAKLSAHGAGEYPVGAANVKELYSGAEIIGYAIELKTKAGAGDAWYWYEKTKADGVIANGTGASGTPKNVCVGCHSSAGQATFGHDLVFTQVK